MKPMPLVNSRPLIGLNSRLLIGSFDIQRKKWPSAASLPVATIVPSRLLESEDHQVLKEPSKNEPGMVVASRLADRVACLTLTSPARLNAMSRAMRADLTRLLAELDEDPDVGAIVVTGAGSRSFSAGQDLSEARRLSGEAAESWVDEWASVYRVVLNLGTPTIAALNGYAVGAGLQTALTCDLRIASRTAQAGMPEINDAIPCITGSWALAGVIGSARIADLVLTGRLIGAEEMLNWGIVSEVVEPDALLGRAKELAEQLARSDALTLQLNKEWLRRERLDGLPAAVQAARLGHRQAFDSGAPAAAMTKFLSRNRA
jgi:enoyl-CoA hydratase/carnithine racemase